MGRDCVQTRWPRLGQGRPRRGWLGCHPTRKPSNRASCTAWMPSRRAEESAIGPEMGRAGAIYPPSPAKTATGRRRPRTGPFEIGGGAILPPRGRMAASDRHRAGIRADPDGLVDRR